MDLGADGIKGSEILIDIRFGKTVHCLECAENAPYTAV